MTLRQQIVAEIMSLVRQQPRKMEPPPTIDELEKILNSESTDHIQIEPDGSVSVTPPVTTVGAVADKVAALVEGELARKDAALRAALEISDWGRGGITQMAFFQASCERVSGAIRSALTPARETGETK